jgi:RNA-directed DNA polymerase
MQALHLLALEPVAEITADPNSYGFRPERSTQDALQQCFCVLARKNCAEWVLEADIQSCFDQISHEWLLTHVVMDRQILQQWLKSGYLEKQQFFSTKEGTPQGGVISPTLANIALNGLERVIKAAAGKRDKVNIIRYADDFIVTGISCEVLVRMKLVIESFLAERGLKLSEKKTSITSIYDGFDFLGFNVRKYGKKLLTKPTKNGIKQICQTIREVTRRNVATPTVNLIRQLNPKLRGWGNYYRHVVSSRAFAKIDHEVFKAVWAWAKRRHPKKSSTWIRSHYFRNCGMRRWIFSTVASNKRGQKQPLDIVIVNAISIKRYVKVKNQATPYDPAYKEYFEQRRQRNKQSSVGYWRHHIAPNCFH